MVGGKRLTDPLQLLIRIDAHQRALVLGTLTRALCMRVANANATPCNDLLVARGLLTPLALNETVRTRRRCAHEQRQRARRGAPNERADNETHFGGCARSDDEL